MMKYATIGFVFLALIGVAAAQQVGPGPISLGCSNPICTTTQTVKINAAGLPTGTTTNGLVLEGVDGTSANIDLLSPGANQGNFTFWAWAGTGASPTALADNQNISNIRAKGYDGSAYAVGGADITSALGVWSVSNHGTYRTFNQVASGSTSQAGVLVLATAGDTVPVPLLNTGIVTDATKTDTAVCQDSTSHQFYFGSGTLGICLGTSSARYKSGITEIIPGLNEVLKLKPKSFYLDKAHGDPKKQMYGFIAEDMVKVLPKLVGLDNQGRPNTADYLGVVPVMVHAMQQQEAQIAEQQSQIFALRTMNAGLRAANDNFNHRLTALEHPLRTVASK